MRQSVLLVFLIGLAFCEKALGRPSVDGDIENDDDLMINDADDDAEDDLASAVILSKGRNFTVSAGETVKLPCEIDNLEIAVVQWRRNLSDALFFDETKQLQEPRYNLSKSHTLTIENVSSVDETSFSCQLIDETDQVITYWITLKDNSESSGQFEQRGHGMPKVIRVIPDQTKTLKKGEPYTIMCEVGGYPQPTISWSHKGKPLKESEGKNAIRIDAATRKDAGKYVCTATNVNGQDSRSAEIQVVYPPEIELANEPIISGEGYESELICIVHSHPTAEVSWYKGNEKLTPTHHINMLQEGHKNILRISATRKTDYGAYTCSATNNLGESKKTVELSGKPSKPVFYNSSYSEDSVTSPLLSWFVRSYKPIVEFEVSYKKQHVDDWVSVPLDDSSRNLYHATEHVYSYTFKDLDPGTYEAKARAKNAYGWSDYSDVHAFAGNDIGRAMQSKLLEASVMSDNSGVSCLELSRISLVFLLSLIVGHHLQ